MDFPLMLTEKQVVELEYEVIPTGLKIKLTRVLRQRVEERTQASETPAIYWQNELINRVNTITERPIYVLTSDDLSDCMPEELVWHTGEFEACIRRLSSVQFIDFLAEAVSSNWLPLSVANSLLSEANSSVYLKRGDSFPQRVSVHVRPIGDLNAGLKEDHRPNVRTLVDRLDRELSAGDYAAVLHCSATIFETVAKDVIGTPQVANKTLGGIFERYRTDSLLPEKILDYIHAVYRRRNTEPLAGHGKLDEPTLTKLEAETLSALTKAFITVETRMSQSESLTS